jgi:hypothetical protein
MYVWHILDPRIVEDVQRALVAKAMRESRSRSAATASEPHVSTANTSSARATEDRTTLANATTLPLPATPPRPVISLSSRPSPLTKSTHPKITFPSYTLSPAHSLESITSYGSMRRSPLPILVTSQDGSTYLDWSGALPAQSTNEKEKSLLGRTFSLTKRRSKVKDRIANMTGRNSLDFRASQGELHAGESGYLFAVVLLCII